MSRRRAATAVATLLLASAASPASPFSPETSASSTDAHADAHGSTAAYTPSSDATCSADPHVDRARAAEVGGRRRDRYEAAVGHYNLSVSTTNHPEAHHALAFYRATGLR